MAASEITDAQGPREAILDELVGRIEAGELQPGTKLLATSQLAKHYGVATKTAQSAVAELARRGYVTRRTGRGTYVTDTDRGRAMGKPAGRPAAGATAAVGLMMSCHGHVWGSFVSSLAKGLGDLALRPVIVDTDGAHDGLPADDTAMEPMVRAMPAVVVVQFTVQVAYVRRRLPHAQLICLESDTGLDSPCDRVTPDFRRIGVMAAEHILARGYRRPACLLLEAVDGSHEPRPDDALILAGLNARLRAAGRAPVTELRARIADLELAHLAPAFAEADTRPDVVLATLAHRAMDLMKSLRQTGLRVPEDIAVMACNETPHAEALDMTAIDQRLDQIARSCLDLIAARHTAATRVSDHRQHLILPQLIPRHTTAPPQA